MPDVPDPYERRGVPHPHQPARVGTDIDGSYAQLGHGAFGGLPVELADEWAERIYDDICAAEERRLLRPPGFAAWPEDAAA